MARGIVTTTMMAAAAPKPDGYLDRVAKYIPAETVALWAAVGGVIPLAPDESQAALLWVSFAAGVILTAVYMWMRVKEMGQKVAITQTVVATLAFIVWVFAIGGPFAGVSWYHPSIGSIALIIYSFGVGAIVPQ